MKKIFIAILLASFQIFYYVGWITYNNSSDIKILQEDSYANKSETVITDLSVIEQNPEYVFIVKNDSLGQQGYKNEELLNTGQFN